MCRHETGDAAESLDLGSGQGAAGGGGPGPRPRTAEASSSEPGPELGGTTGNGRVTLPEEDGKLTWLNVQRPFSGPGGEGSGDSPHAPWGERSMKRRSGAPFGRLIRARTPRGPREGTESGGPEEHGGGAADTGERRRHLDRVWPDAPTVDDPAREHDPWLRSVPITRASGDLRSAGRVTALVAPLRSAIDGGRRRSKAVGSSGTGRPTVFRTRPPRTPTPVSRAGVPPENATRCGSSASSPSPTTLPPTRPGPPW